MSVAEKSGMRSGADIIRAAWTPKCMFLCSSAHRTARAIPKLPEGRLPLFLDEQEAKINTGTMGGFHMRSTFAQIGGARIGIFNATWPLARLSANRDAIALRCLLRLTFPRAKITGLNRYRGFMSTGLQIEHAVPRYPRFTLFWTFNFDLLKAELEALGYTVRD